MPIKAKAEPDTPSLCPRLPWCKSPLRHPICLRCHHRFACIQPASRAHHHLFCFSSPLLHLGCICWRFQSRLVITPGGQYKHVIQGLIASGASCEVNKPRAEQKSTFTPTSTQYLMSRIPVPTGTYRPESPVSMSSPATDTRKKQSKRDEVSVGFSLNPLSPHIALPVREETVRLRPTELYLP